MIFRKLLVLCLAAIAVMITPNVAKAQAYSPPGVYAGPNYNGPLSSTPYAYGPNGQAYGSRQVVGGVSLAGPRVIVQQPMVRVQTVRFGINAYGICQPERPYCGGQSVYFASRPYYPPPCYSVRRVYYGPPCATYAVPVRRVSCGPRPNSWSVGLPFLFQVNHDF